MSVCEGMDRIVVPDSNTSYVLLGEARWSDVRFCWIVYLRVVYDRDWSKETCSDSI